MGPSRPATFHTRDVTVQTPHLAFPLGVLRRWEAARGWHRPAPRVASTSPALGSPCPAHERGARSHTGPGPEPHQHEAVAEAPTSAASVTIRNMTLESSWWLSQPPGSSKPHVTTRRHGVRGEFCRVHKILYLLFARMCFL